MKVLLVKPNCAPEVMEISGDLESMQSLVGGTIQAIYPFPEHVALIANDDGKLIGLPMNRAVLEIGDVICGDFFLCGSPPDGDHFTSLTDEQIAHFKERFRCPETFLLLDDGTLLTLRTN